MAYIIGTDPLLTDLDYANLTVAEQSKVDALLEVGTQFIEKYCNRIFSAATYTSEEHNGTDWNEIYVNNPPIRALTSVVIRYGNVLETDETYATNYFETDANTGRISFSLYNITSSEGLSIPSYFPVGFNNIRITYDGGFVSVPEPIQMVLADFAILSYNSLGEDEIVSEKLGQYSYKTKGSVTGNVDPYSVMSKYYNFLKLYKIRRV